MLNDLLANVLSKIMNCERIGKKECTIKPSSKIIKSVLDILNKEGYVGNYIDIKDTGYSLLKINLLGKVNKCGVIKPRFAVKNRGFEKYEKRYLPAQGFGVIIVSTNKGIMSHKDAISKKLGGKLIAYCY